MTLYRLFRYGPPACVALIVVAVITAIQRREHRITYMAGDET